MSDRPLAGLTPSWVPTPPGRAGTLGAVSFRLGSAYARMAAEAGCEAVSLLPGAGPPGSTVSLLDLLVLTGGGLLPASLGDVEAEPEEAGPARALWEVSLYGTARQAGVPVLGICHGMQVMAIAEGASLVTDIASEVQGCLAHSGSPEDPLTHPVETARDTALRRLLGKAPEVSSYHRQAVGQAPPGYRAAARSGDGLLEAIESIDGMAIGVQWHPERDGSGPVLVRHLLELKGAGGG